MRTSNSTIAQRRAELIGDIEYQFRRIAEMERYLPERPWLMDSIVHAKLRIYEMREELKRLAQADSDAEFEARCDRRLEAYVAANKGRAWRCTECGERYGAAYRYHYRECAECGGDLEIEGGDK